MSRIEESRNIARASLMILAEHEAQQFRDFITEWESSMAQVKALVVPELRDDMVPLVCEAALRIKGDGESIVELPRPLLPWMMSLIPEDWLDKKTVN